MTGVEGGVRWLLERRPSHHPPSDLENASEGSNKRRKLETEDTDMDRSTPHDPYGVYRQELQHRQRRPSHGSTTESLPAYDDQRSPSYETAQALVSTRQQEDSQSLGSSWQSRLVLSTSGLSVAMSEESLRSLKYCLGWLRWANEHIGKVIEALKAALEAHDQPSGTIEGETLEGQLITRTEAERSALNARIGELKADVLKTLKDVVDIVSKYAGGALPENARVLVRGHLTSLPQRFRLASRTTQRGGNADAELTESANSVLVLAKEGLDMMGQVSGVVGGTIESAEEWCERLGRGKREGAEGSASTQEASSNEKSPLEFPPVGVNGNGDVKMG